ncbi:MAG: hypothetical protein ABI847_00750 [Anaerolineales bacterium]
MNSTLKVILGVVGGALLTCVAIAVLGLVFFGTITRAVLRNTQAKPGEAEQIAQEIADFTLPDGYSAAMASRIAHFELVGYNGPDGHSHIYLFQLPPAIHVDQVQLERQFQDTTGNPSQTSGRAMTVIEEQAVTIRGEATTLVISEGTNGAGELYRSANTAFWGKDGQALLSFSGLTSDWDQTMIDAFIASVR